MNHIFSNTSLLLNPKTWKYLRFCYLNVKVGASLFEIYIEIYINSSAQLLNKMAPYLIQDYIKSLVCAFLHVRLFQSFNLDNLLTRQDFWKNIFKFIKRFWKFKIYLLWSSTIFMLPQITSNWRYGWVGFYVNLSTLSRGSLTINVQSNYHSTAFVL